MSASSKKKLRNAQNAEKLTERQVAEQKEAKKLKILTIVVVSLVVVMVVFAAWTAISKTIANSGIRERSTAAVTIGEHELSNAQLNYFFVDSVNQFYQSYGAYASMFGLDLTKPLDEQYVDEETGYTWADDFLKSAIEDAKAVYAMHDAAVAAGHTLTEAEQKTVDSALSNLTLYAAYAGYASPEAYAKALYGNGTTLEDLRAYYEMTTLAQSYYAAYQEALTYTDAELREAEKDNYDLYSSYSYNYYYVLTSKFLEGGTTDEDGETVYTDAEQKAAEEAAKAAAEALAAGEYASVEEFDAAIAAMSINAENANATSYAYTDNSYSGISSLYAEWVTDEARVAGDMTFVPSTSTTTDDDGKETTTTNGYYVVYYVGSNTNEFPLVNVRHCLVSFEGGSYDSETGTTTYSDEEKAAAMEQAEALLNEWLAGEATEDSFAAMANEKSDDGDGTTGGLYKDVYPGEMVTNFNDWCFDESRKVGDYGIVETEYGCHIMYFSGDSSYTYRDHLITADLIENDMTEWNNALLEAMTVTELDMSLITTGLVVQAG